MNGYELLVPYVVADRQARAEADRLARLAQKQAKAPAEVDAFDGERHEFAPEPWVPVLLRGYPYDPEFGR
jgi:hypothetical protein